MSVDTQYDAIVIGSGQGGGPFSTALHAAGKRVALIEREHIGGTCINVGCTPTKTMIASARVAYMAHRSSDFGVESPAALVDLTAVRQRKRDIVQTFREGSTHAILSGGVDIVWGEARFTGPRELDVRLTDGGSRTITAPLIVIDTGTRPAVPHLDGLDDVPFLNSTTIMELDRVPDRLIVLGGGYIGLEFGQMFRRFGSRVTIVQMLPKLMGREDDDIADAVAGILREDGIELLLDTHATRVERDEEGTIRLTVESQDGKNGAVDGTHLLVAVGRSPNTEALNLGAAGIETDAHGFIKVDDRLQTTVEGVYAIGDVTGEPQFTHISYDDFRILRANLIEGDHRSTRDRLIPYTMFTDPELGRVGMTEKQARDAGRNIRVAKMPMSGVARALEVDESRGLMKAIVDAETDQILGCSILGIQGGELMAMMEIAMMGRLPYTALREGIFAHPTLAESFNNLFGSWVE